MKTDFNIHLLSPNFTREELDAYDKYWDSIIAKQTLIEDAERKGKIEGRLEGKIEGRLEGKMEGAIETARRMKRKGFLPSDIAELTGLSVEDIDTL